MKAMNSLQEVVDYLVEHDDFIVVGHENPDPDCLGSMLGLYFGLTQLGKKCRVVSADPVPQDLSWPGLDVIEHISTGFTAGNSCVIVVDCEPDRTGSISEGVKSAKRLVNIDHHQRGRGIGDIVYVDPSEAATCTIIYRLLRELKVAFDREIATALYGGIIGDTGGFRHANTNSEVLFIAGELLKFDINPSAMAREIFSSQPLGFLRLLGVTLSDLQTAQDGQLAWMTVSYEQFLAFGVDPKSSDHLVSFTRMLDTAEIAIVFRETNPGKIRVGLRANHVDVGSLARQIGGGGHKLAAGATIVGNLQEVSASVVKMAEHFLSTGELNEWHC
ncbi:MAG TPA: bifunctional oligoribonuclease/PAP phosphatase NrnA [Limnochordia bacterium]|nr:bifunctional oligoribonuclease/PAP phosphatase NrnA [Limnochordia bacterium]